MYLKKEKISLFVTLDLQNNHQQHLNQDNKIKKKDGQKKPQQRSC